MTKQPVARLGDSGNHGGRIVSAKSPILADGISMATVGDMYACPIHGTNPIVSGMPGSFGTNELIAHVGSHTACGDVIATGSTKVFVDAPPGVSSSAGFTELDLHYVNTCRLCKKEVDGDPLRDISYNRYFQGKEDAVCCDKDWNRRIRRIIDTDTQDIDGIWQRLCQWYVEHKTEWRAKDSFMSIVITMDSVLGRNYYSIKDKADQDRWLSVKKSLGNIRFGGRGEVDYPSFDKVQHFLGGAGMGNETLAIFAGDVVESRDAFIRTYGEIRGNIKPHHVGYDLHDMEWTWAGGAFFQTIYEMPEEKIDTILTHYADSTLIFSDTYHSIMPTKDGAARFEHNPHIDHAEQNIPPLSDMIGAFAKIRENIGLMKTRLVQYAQ